MWMNEWEVEDTLATALRHDLPVMTEGALRLIKLVNWTNSHSDGWPYWSKPSRAANRLMELLHGVGRTGGGRDELEDISEADLKKAFSPIKAFLTRQGVDHSIIFG